MGEKWYEKYSWLVFILIALTGIVPAIQLLLSPLSGEGFFAGFGHPIPASILSVTAETVFIEFVLRWIGTILLGGNLLTVFIAATVWRSGKKWAWFAMWYWPLMFATHFFLYGDGFLKYLQIFWVLLCLATLGVNYKRFFQGS
ncbi:MAG: hypothetical protein WAM60_12405 [Candidatus Promineifilaceae bacterium]